MNFPSLRPPDSLFILKTAAAALKAAPANSEHLVWEAGASRVELRAETPRRLAVTLASSEPVRRVFLRWKAPLEAGALILGDAWERSYGLLEWRGPNPHRPLPWYFLLSDGTATAAWGVETGAASIACWRVDVDGFTLELDVRAGGVGVELGARQLKAATILQRPPQAGETPYAAACAFCREMCPAPLMPKEPVVGHNDWYWLYGKNSAELILDATRRFMDLYPTTPNAPRPWSVIDDGWQDFSSKNCGHPGGPWAKSNAQFPDMAGLAAGIKETGARPGIWMRPLFTYADVPAQWTLETPGFTPPSGSHRLDPSVPEVLELVRADVARIRGWGYELIKHDFSTFDVTGRWGFEMDRTLDGFTADGWALANRSMTTAEAILGLYRAIREAAGPETLILGCNTVSHLAAGLVEIQRTGDDTSASEWDRTRRMGVNTLAFRAPQQGTFYAVDADCVPISPNIPWPLTEDWLKLVAESGTPLFLSMDPATEHPRRDAAIQAALESAAKVAPVAEPLDWLQTAVPARWKLQGKTAQFAWSEWDV